MPLRLLLNRTSSFIKRTKNLAQPLTRLTRQPAPQRNLYRTFALLSAAGLTAYFLQNLHHSYEERSIQEREAVGLILHTIREEFPQMLPKDFANTEWWRQLEKEGYLERTGDDKTWRPVFVNLQGAIEAAVILLQSQGKLKIEMHCTHTDLPSSPLCEIDERDMHPHIAADPARRSTVYTRIIVMANMLKANAPIFSAYSPDGLSKRTAEAQQRYKNNVARFPNLHDVPLGKKIEAQDSGATAIMSLPQPAQFNYFSPGRLLFSIASLQATTEGNQWKLVLDGMQEPRTFGAKQIVQQREGFFASTPELEGIHHILSP